MKNVFYEERPAIFLTVT